MPTDDDGLVYYSPPGAACTYCGQTGCDGCPLCCCAHPKHRGCADCRRTP